MEHSVKDLSSFTCSPNLGSTSTMAGITAIWQRVLQRSPVGSEDNFFDLGGSPASATALFREIECTFGKRLSPVTIYTAPTVTSLAALLESSSPPRFHSVVKLKEGTVGPPVFLAHGLDSDVLEFFELVKHVQSVHPIYGLQARGTDGWDKPCTTIEEMAQFHLQQIQKLQPEGPYTLIGYSLGGLVMLEVARQLSENEQCVSLLMMIDSYPHRRHLPFAERLNIFFREAKHQLLTWRWTHSREHLPLEMERVRACASMALESYRPHYYHGAIMFVRAAVSLHFPEDPTKIWAELADDFEVDRAPGDHHGMLTTHYKPLAAIISRRLRQSSRAKLGCQTE